ncbi:MAG: NADH-quinone oxidoreductase subunit L, partial [Alphaproteobacteria bacterium]
VSAMVHVYSIGYMSHDKSIPRFMAYLSLFTFFMLTLVTSDNFVQLYFGWEGVGLCSYLLIGFWYDRPSANAAAIKAFVVNRVGDFGFALGIAGIFLVFDSISFAEVFARAPEVAGQSFSFLGAQWDTLTVLCLLLFVGAMGKSAQIGLHTWLPDAMEGPTPVSALIHAATMVTAGVFMVVRLSPVFEYAPVALTVVAVVGGVTAFFAATVALTQTDIKRVIAYSTCSQLGYMFFAVGVSAYPAAIFHLTTHAFFKALLFLGAGAVIHAIGDEQDMRNMGGLRHKMRVTWVLMWIGSLALAGIPFFAGFFSKDIILESAWAAGTQAGNFAFWAGIVAALLTAFYSWRLLYLTFHGHNRGDPEVYAHAHEAPPVMLMPLAVLAVGAVVAGALLAEPFVGDHWHDFWGNAIFIRDGNDALHDAHSVGIVIKLLPIAVAGIGIALATWFYATRSRAPAALARDFAPVHRFLLAKWYFDELYDLVFVRGANALGRVFWRRGDGGVIDRFGPDGVAWGSRLVALRAGLLQSG